MLRRLRPPECELCGKNHSSMYSVDDFGGLIVCSFCVHDVKNYLANHNLLDSNPFAEALLDDGDPNSTKSHYHVWIQVPGQPGTFRGTLVSRVVK